MSTKKIDSNRDIKTTDLDTIKKDRSRFQWGRILNIHEIGSLTIVEFLPSITSPVEFHLYVDGKDTSSGAKTLDGTLLLGIAAKRLGANEARYAAKYAAQILTVKDNGVDF
jgi:hypothetical protein